jgi:hypothetical protein
MITTYNEKGTYALQTIKEGLTIDTCRTMAYATLRKKELEKQLKCELKIVKLK